MIADSCHTGPSKLKLSKDMCRAAEGTQLRMQIQPGNDQLCGTIPSSVQALNVTFETSYGAQLYTCAPADPRHDPSWKSPLCCIQ